MNTENAVEQPELKRRRVTIACTTCRARKTRCDGTRPKCDACVQMGHECSFVQPHANNDAHRDDSRQSSELMKRLEKIEAAMKASSESDAYSFEQGQKQLPHSTGAKDIENQALSPNDQMHSATSYSPSSRMSAKRDYSRYNENNTDGMAAVAASSDDEDLGDGEGPYYGPSSNITLIKEISSALFRTQPVREWHHIHLLSDQRPRTKRPALDDSEPPRDLENLQSQAIDPYELPPLPEAQAYISHFFTQVALFLSYLHQKSFLETFRCHRANLQQGRPSAVSKVWLGILNLVFAISRTTMEGNTPDANKLAVCEIFYQRAMKLAERISLRGRSVEIVQFLQLKSTFLQGTERSGDVWTTHIYAINTAFSIGLHNTQSNKSLSPLEREIRTRTWYCLLIDDHTLSTAWGRPSLTAGVSPQIITQFKEDTGFYPANVPKAVTSMASCYLSSTVSLGFISQDTIHELYDHNSNSATGLGVYQTVSRTNEICWRLNNWRNALPEQLQPSVRGEALSWELGPELHIVRLRCFLSLRYHNLQITAYRAVLSKFLDDSYSQESYEKLHRTGLDLLHDCVHSCIAIIDNVQDIIKASEEQIIINGAWWLFSYYLFNASLVLCGITIAIPRKTDESWAMSATVIRDAREAFGRGVVALNSLDRGSAVVSRCCSVLNRFAELLDLSGELGIFFVLPPLILLFPSPLAVELIQVGASEDRTTGSVPADGSSAFTQTPMYQNLFNPFGERNRLNTGDGAENVSPMSKDPRSGDGMMFPPDQDFVRDAEGGFGVDGLDYLLEIMSSGNNALDFI